MMVFSFMRTDKRTLWLFFSFPFSLVFSSFFSETEAEAKASVLYHCRVFEMIGYSISFLHPSLAGHLIRIQVSGSIRQPWTQEREQGIATPYCMLARKPRCTTSRDEVSIVNIQSLLPDINTYLKWHSRSVWILEEIFELLYYSRG